MLATNTYFMWNDNTQLDAAIPHDLSVRAAILIVALGLDALVGDPRWLWGHIPHPVVLFGRAIAELDRFFNRPCLAGIRLTGKVRRGLGMLTIILLVSIAGVAGGGIAAVASSGGIALSLIMELIFVAILLAGRSLADHAAAVVDTLENGTIKEARNAVSKIIGRNTEVLDKSAIVSAAIESTAENISDGVVAPALFYLVFGLPGMFAYKMINTSDSMIGYRSARHLAFGWGAAQLDDLSNLLPARLSGLLIAFAEPRRALRAIVVMFRDAPHHRSPNAGWPEAAMAVALGCSLGGPRPYYLRISPDQEMNQGVPRAVKATDITRAVTLMWRAIAMFALLIGVVALA